MTLTGITPTLSKPRRRTHLGFVVWVGLPVFSLLWLAGQLSAGRALLGAALLVPLQILRLRLSGRSRRQGMLLDLVVLAISILLPMIGTDRFGFFLPLAVFTLVAGAAMRYVIWRHRWVHRGVD